MKYEIIIYSSLLYNAAVIIFLLFLKSIFGEWEVIWQDWEKSLNSIAVADDVDMILLNSLHTTPVCLTQYSASYLWMMYYRFYIVYEQPLHFHNNKCEAGFKFVSVILL